MGMHDAQPKLWARIIICMTLIFIVAMAIATYLYVKGA